MKKRFSLVIAVFLICVTIQPFACAEGAADFSGAAAAVAADPADRGHYVFRPVVCSVFMKEVFGDAMCETWENLVNAVLAGENTFACPDKHTHDWVMGQFPKHCLPILPELIDYAYDRSHPVNNGVASFTWLVSPEEAAARIAEFGQQIEEILNTVLRDDDTDFEKAAALYDYFCRTYQYNWDTYRDMFETYVETTPMSIFQTGTGVCSEIAPAYSYLLMQAGVEATTIMGGDHEWSYVRIGGHDYHIDPTFALNTEESLEYFMMNDEQRAASGFTRDRMTITSNYSSDHPHPVYTADDSTYSVLWDYRFDSLYPDENRLRCRQYTDEGEETTFDYFYD